MEQTFKEYLKEGKVSFDSPEDMATQIEKMIKGYFPKSFANVKAVSNLGKSINITSALGSGKSEWANGIFQNDPAITSIMIHRPSNDENFMDEKMQAEGLQTSLTISPTKQYMAYGSLKTGWRKKSGNPEVIFKHVENHFKKLKSTIKDNLDKMTPEHRKIAEKKV